MKISTCSTKSKLAMLFSLIASVSMLPAIGEELVNFNGTYTEEPHPTLEGVNVVKLTNSGTLTVDEDVRLVRILLVGGGGGGGNGGGGGGQVLDWTPEETIILKHDDAYTATVGWNGFRSSSGSPQARGHNGYPSSFYGNSINLYVLGGGGGRGWFGEDDRWDPEEPKFFGNGGGGAGTDEKPGDNIMLGYEPGTNGCFKGGAATNYGRSGVGCGGGGGGAGAAGDGYDSQIFNTANNNDASVDEFGNYEHAGNGGPGVISDITGEAISYGDGGGGGVRRSNYKHGGIGGLGGGGRGAGLYEGTFTGATAAAANRGGGGGGAGWPANGGYMDSAHGGTGVIILLVTKCAPEDEAPGRASTFAYGGHVKTWVEDDRQNVAHEFRGNGILEITRPVKAELLLVGGGGAGGSKSGCGGGAGGLIHVEEKLLTPDIYTITVGEGGCHTTGWTKEGGITSIATSDGTVLFSAFGGGAGGGYFGGNSKLYAGTAGGSGGGSTGQHAGGEALLDENGQAQGFRGGNSAPSGWNGGGGGGAGSPGGDATTGSSVSNLGVGGDGLSFDISGEERIYAAGGGAGYTGSTSGNNCSIHTGGSNGIGGHGEPKQSHYRRLTGFPGLDGTGSGGGGSGQGDGVGGKGGTGVFILRYGVISGPTYIIIR